MKHAALLFVFGSFLNFTTCSLDHSIFHFSDDKIYRIYNINVSHTDVSQSCTDFNDMEIATTDPILTGLMDQLGIKSWWSKENKDKTGEKVAVCVADLETFTKNYILEDNGFAVLELSKLSKTQQFLLEQIRET